MKNMSFDMNDRLLNNGFLFSACETVYFNHEVEDDEPDCTTEKEEVCDDDGENCVEYDKQVCQEATVTNTKTVPDTKCRSIPTEVCGKQDCPIVKGDLECRVRTKYVRLEKAYACILIHSHFFNNRPFGVCIDYWRGMNFHHLMVCHIFFCIRA